MIVRIAEPEIDPDRIDAYRAHLAEEIEASVRLEPGVLFLFAVSIKDSPNSVRIFEGYADRSAYEAHLAAPHFIKYKAETGGMVLSLRLLETDPIAIRSGGHLSG